MLAVILVISSRLAGPLAVAVAGLRKWYVAPDAQVRRDLAELQERLRLEAIGGHSGSRFDPEELASQARGVGPLLVSYAAAADALACSDSKVKRLVVAGELEVVGVGRGARVTVASLRSYVARASARPADGSAHQTSSEELAG